MVILSARLIEGEKDGNRYSYYRLALILDGDTEHPIPITVDCKDYSVKKYFNDLIGKKIIEEGGTIK